MKEAQAASATRRRDVLRSCMFQVYNAPTYPRSCQFSQCLSSTSTLRRLPAVVRLGRPTDPCLDPEYRFWGGLEGRRSLETSPTKIMTPTLLNCSSSNSTSIKRRMDRTAGAFSAASPGWFGHGQSGSSANRPDGQPAASCITCEPGRYTSHPTG